MDVGLPGGRLGLTLTYAALAQRYWLGVLPDVKRLLARQRARAEEIACSRLGALAREALAGKQGNVEGAAAFAAFAPYGRRVAAVEALASFQMLCDYLDLVAERSEEHVAQNAAQLHRALVAAIDPDAAHVDYYACAALGDDGGYLLGLVEQVRSAARRLPSYASLSNVALRLVADAARFQSLNLPERHGGHAELARWACTQQTPEASLRWWEAAAANSTPGLLALIAAAARDGATSADAWAIAKAYRPWVEALHTLLDSAVDEAEDSMSGQRSLLDYYATEEELIARLRLITHEAIHSVARLPNGREHVALVGAMIAFYLVPAPRTARGPRIAAAVLDAAGFPIVPARVMLGVRHAFRPTAARSPHESPVGPLVTARDEADARRAAGLTTLSGDPRSC